MQFFVIGQGAIGKRHAGNLAKLGQDVTILPWRGIDLPALFAQLSDLQSGAGVVVATKTDIRLPLIRELADTGAALYLEKPLAFRRADIEEIFSIPESVQKRSMVGFMMRYHPLVKYLIDNLDESMYRAEFEIAHDVTQWRENWVFKDSYAASNNGGGVLLDLCHEIDLCQLLLGPLNIERVASIGTTSFPKVDVATDILLSNNIGLICKVTMDYLAPFLRRRGVLLGENKEITYDFVDALVTIKNGDECERKSFNLDRNEMFIAAMKDFVHLAGGGEAENSLVPRLDKMYENCMVIAEAWESRHFLPPLEKDF